MSNFDVRDMTADVVESLTFADAERNSYAAHRIEESDEGIFITNEDGDKVTIRKGDVNNFLKAIEHAKKLGWLSNES